MNVTEGKSTKISGLKTLKKRLFNLKRFTRIILALYLFILPWQTVYIFQENYLNGFKWEYGTINFYLSEIVLYIFIFCVLLLVKKRKIVFDKRIKKIFLPALFFIVYIFVISLFSGNLSLSLHKSRQIFQLFLLFFSLILFSVHYSFVARWLLYGSLLPSILGIFQFITQTSFYNKFLGLSAHLPWSAGTSVVSGELLGRWMRAYGSFSHPNVFGGYLLVVLVLYLSFLFKKKKVNSFLQFIFIFLPICALLFSFSRSAWLAFAVFLSGLLYFSFIESKQHILRLILYLFLIIFSFSVLFFPIIKIRFEGSSVHEVISINERLSGYNTAFNLLEDNMFFGVGPGLYTQYLYNISPIYPGWFYQPVHNVFLLFFAEVGLVGLLFVLLFIKKMIYGYMKMTKDNKIFWLPVLSFLILGMFDHYLYSSYFGMSMSVIFTYFMINFVKLDLNLS